MTILWAAADAAAATGGRLTGPDWVATGVSIDTRTLQPGDLFVALKDARDGHEFVAEAFAKGAAAALVARVPDELDGGASLLIVEDVLAALEGLGTAARARSSATVIAVTGSAGKTSTKDMLNYVLAHQGPTHAAEASYNNHWGVPLTLARMPADTAYAIIEIGMNHPGEIAPLARLARPHVAIITTVAAAHLEAFGSIADIAREKASIFEGLEPGGTAVFNADIETASILANIARSHSERLVGFGALPGAVLHANDLRLSEAGTVVRGKFKGAPFLFKVGAPGRHFAMNALAVYGAAIVAGADADVVSCDIGQWTPPAGRGHREILQLDPIEDLTAELIDDAFNANPASMGAALWVLSVLSPKDRVGLIEKGRRIAVLGDMLELGPTEISLHAGLADHPAMAAVDRVDCVGPRMHALYSALPEEKRGHWVAEAEELASQAHTLVDAGDVVLVKGSKGSRVSLVVEALKNLGRDRRQTANKGAN